MTTTAGDSNEVKNNTQDTPESDATDNKKGGIATQSFDKIGLFEVKEGDIVLRGRRGERDHVYPLEKLVNKYQETQYMLFAMARRGIRGWDTLADVVQDMRAKIVEAVEQRKKLNREIPKSAQDFAELHSNVKHTVITVKK